jgi:hypothetical protein
MILSLLLSPPKLAKVSSSPVQGAPTVPGSFVVADVEPSDPALPFDDVDES